MSDCFTHGQGKLPGAAYDLAIRLGVSSAGQRGIVTLTQTGRMKRKSGAESWMAFSAVQTISIAKCSFEWHARFGPGGIVSVSDALQNGVGRLDVNLLGFIPVARTARTPALTRGELMRYLGEPSVPNRFPP